MNQIAVCWFTFIFIEVSTYHQTFDINHTKFQNLNVSHFVLKLSLANLLKPGVNYVKKEDVVAAAPTGNTPITSEWSTILLPTKV